MQHEELRSYCGSRLVKFDLWIFIHFKDTFNTGEPLLIIFFQLVFFTYSKWNSDSRTRRLNWEWHLSSKLCQQRLMTDWGDFMITKPIKLQKTQ